MAAVKQTSEEMKRVAIATRMGVNADEKQFPKFIDTLDGRKSQRGVDPEFLQRLKILETMRKKGSTDYPGRVPRKPEPPKKR